MKEYKKIIFLLAAILIVFGVAVSSMNSQKNEKSSKPLIALSTFSLYDITKHIAAGSVDTVMILPFGVDAHSFEPTPKLMANIIDSDLVIYSGAGLEPWIAGFEFKKSVVDMSAHMKLRELDSEEDEEHGHHEHSKTDPHYWQDIDNMIRATEIIRDELIKILPVNQELFTNNSAVYITMLESLDEEYKEKLSTCQGDTIVVNHNAFSYLSNKYNFNVVALSGLSPDAQPSPKDMIRVINSVKEHNVSTLFFESFVSDKAVKSIADEVKVKVEVLQPLENITESEAKQNLSFEDIMRDNLRKISNVLVCR